MEHDNCKGCVGINFFDLPCEMAEYNDEGICPCTECLVKPTCGQGVDMEDLCDPFIDFASLDKGALGK